MPGRPTCSSRQSLPPRPLLRLRWFSMVPFSQLNFLPLPSFVLASRQSMNLAPLRLLKGGSLLFAKNIWFLTSISSSQRVADLSAGLLSWPLAVIKSDFEDIKMVNGMDSYFFVRFIRMMVKIFLPIWLISWAVLMPVTSVNTSVPGHSGLDIFIFGNVAPDKTERYAAHVILAWLFTCKCFFSFSSPIRVRRRKIVNVLTFYLLQVWIWYNIKYEMANFITTRQHYLISAERASSVQATTILVTGIPAKFLSEQALLQMYSRLPGGVKRIWINRCVFNEYPWPTHCLIFFL